MELDAIQEATFRNLPVFRPGGRSSSGAVFSVNRSNVRMRKAVSKAVSGSVIGAILGAIMGFFSNHWMASGTGELSWTFYGILVGGMLGAFARLVDAHPNATSNPGASGPPPSASGMRRRPSSAFPSSMSVSRNIGPRFLASAMYVFLGYGFVAMLAILLMFLFGPDSVFGRTVDTFDDFDFPLFGGLPIALLLTLVIFLVSLWRSRRR
jgi:hypothetical protein